MKIHTIACKNSLVSTKNILLVAVGITLTGIVGTSALSNGREPQHQNPQDHQDEIHTGSAHGDSPADEIRLRLTFPSLDGRGNNRRNPDLGAVGTLYSRVSEPAYADGVGVMSDGPELRYISNRIFADGAQNLFSENGVTQWAYNWGQFIDHTIGLREEGDERIAVTFNEHDPLEHFSNSALSMSMTRSAVAPGSGDLSPREQLNTVSSFIDAWAVYGGTDERLEWLREGPVDDDLGNNNAKLLLTEQGYLPAATARGDAQNAPVMERNGHLLAIANADDQQIVAGDMRANENIALTTVQTLFAREHNRIVGLLPDDISEQLKFDIARQIVIATQQYITYNEFLPAIGVRLKPATRYRSNVNPSVTNEFASVGYRVHSMIHGEIELELPLGYYSDEQLEKFRTSGIGLEEAGDQIELAVPLNVAFFNPQLAVDLGVGPISAALGAEAQYKNDEQIDNQLRSILFQLPDPDVLNPDECLDGPTLSECFLLANDLGSLDIFRGRDHGIAPYNDLREAYGLNRLELFTDVTGEDTEEFPVDDPMIDAENTIDDLNILDFIELRDQAGNVLLAGSTEADASAVVGKRRTTLAARLKAIYGEVDNIDSFVGAVSEVHVAGSELGELQHAIWKHQFESLRDGDSGFYLWNNNLRKIMREFSQHGIGYEQSLAEVIYNNTDVQTGDLSENVFLLTE